jgi:hypothetical protein
LKGSLRIGQEGGVADRPTQEIERLERVARMVRETGVTFGYCLGCWCDPRPAAAQSAIDYVVRRHQNVASQSFNVPIGNGEQLHGAVIGLAVAAGGYKGPPVPVADLPEVPES